MSQQVKVVNRALSFLGAGSVTSIEDESVEALTALTHYQMSLDAMMDARNWSFLIERFIPALHEDPPVWGYTSKFLIPSNISRIIWVGPDKEVYHEHEQYDWQVEGSYIVCNKDIIYCVGMLRPTAEGGLSPLFLEAFAYKLASEMAIALTQSSTIKDKMDARFLIELDRAIAMDSVQGRTMTLKQRRTRRSRSIGVIGARW